MSSVPFQLDESDRSSIGSKFVSRSVGIDGQKKTYLCAPVVCGRRSPPTTAFEIYGTL